MIASKVATYGREGGREGPAGNNSMCTNTTDILDAEYTENQISMKKININSTY